jgi:catechol 2,3-dioxygenase-like lactoylglutathione lyase family enzyme
MTTDSEPRAEATIMSFTQLDTTTATQSAGVVDVDDIEAARAELIRRGVDVSEIWHLEPGEGRVPGLDPQRRSYFSRASFADPDGNTWTLQEVTPRLPGRVEMRRTGALPRLLFETARRHGAFGADVPAHDWWDWYDAYADAREHGSIAEKAAEVAGRYLAAVKHVAVASA